MTASLPTTQWRLWVDRCGGYSLLSGDRCRIGGCRPDATAEVQVRADWRRWEGSLIRRGGDYFWSPEAGRGIGESGQQADVLLHHGGRLPIEGSATLRLAVPSPLSATAMLSLDPPHRFDGHIDQVAFVDHTLLIGPGSQNHIRCVSLEDSVVMVLRGGRWRAKREQPAIKGGRIGRRAASVWVDLVAGQRVSIGELDMMLEEV